MRAAPNLKLNIIANYVGSVWYALMGVLFVPVFIKFMGIESYGLVTSFTTLLSLFAILDMGLGMTLRREMARRSLVVGEEQNTRDLLRTIEVVYWAVAILIGAVVVGLSYPISRHWINPEKLSESDVQQTVMIMGLAIVLRWPFGLYQGGLMGLEKQVLVNGINAFFSTFRSLGAVGVLWLVSPTIQAFFCWQIIVCGLETCFSGYFLWHYLPKSQRRSRFQRSLFREIWSFASGMMGINVVVMILLDGDKIVLSKMLTLEMYGYYMLCWTVAGSLYRLVYPIAGAVFPRFSQLVSMRDTAGLIDLYHKSCQFMSVMVWPVSVVLALFSFEIMLAWTGDQIIARETHLTASLLIIGTACNAMMNLPFQMQLAYGWTSLSFWVNVTSIIILVPLLVLFVSLYGMVGGGIVWVALNIGYVLITIPIMHRRVIRRGLRNWYVHDVGVPFVAALAPALIGRFLFTEAFSTIWTITILVLIMCLSFMFTTVSAREIRHSIVNVIAKLWARPKFST